MKVLKEDVGEFVLQPWNAIMSDEINCILFSCGKLEWRGGRAEEMNVCLDYSLVLRNIGVRFEL
jgi:hypothetical protein